MLSCVIIEDQLPAQRVLKKYIVDYGKLELKGSFTNAVEAVAFLAENPVDLLFLDIHLPRISGVEFLRSLQQRPAVIFTTAFSEYAVESYELEVTDYLMKPFSYERFVKAVSKVSIPAVVDLVHAFYIKSGHERIRVESTELLFIRTDMDYTELHLSDRKHLSGETLTHWEQQLNDHGFVRIHKSYLVNLTKVERVTGSQAFLISGSVLPIGRAFKQDFLAKWGGSHI